MIMKSDALVSSAAVAEEADALYLVRLALLDVQQRVPGRPGVFDGDMSVRGLAASLALSEDQVRGSLAWLQRAGAPVEVLTGGVVLVPKGVS